MSPLKPCLLLLGCLVAGQCSKTDPEPLFLEIDLDNAEHAVRNAIAAALDGVRRNPGDSAAWGELGMTLHAHRRVEPAIQAYRRAAALSSLDRRWTYLLARVLDVNADPEALQDFKRAIELDADDPAFRVAYGTALLRVNRLDEAEQQLRKGYELSLGTSTHACLGLAQVAIAEERLDEAVSWLEKGRTIAPRFGKIHAVLASLYARVDRKEEAIEAMQLSRSSPAEWPERDAIFEMAMSRCVSIASLHQNALSMLQRGERSAAIAEWQRILGMDPAQVDAHLQLAGLCAEDRSFDEARDHLQAVLRAQPDNLSALLRSIQLCRVHGDSSGALDGLKKLVALDPDGAPTLELLTSLPAAMQRDLLLDVAQGGGWKAAQTSCQRLLENDPKSESSREMAIFLRVAAPDSEISIVRSTLAESREACATWAARRPLMWCARALAARKSGELDDARSAAAIAADLAHGSKAWSPLVPMIERAQKEIAGAVPHPSTDRRP